MNFVGANKLAMACLPAWHWDRVFWVPSTGCDAVPPPNTDWWHPEGITGSMFGTDGTVVVGVRDMIDLPPSWPVIGCHPSLLPHGRGRCAIQWNVWQGELGGLTFFRMVEKVDAGPILAQQCIGRPLTSAEYYDRILWIASTLLQRAILGWKLAAYEGIEQVDDMPARRALRDTDQECMTEEMRGRVYSGPYAKLRRKP